VDRCRCRTDGEYAGVWMVWEVGDKTERMDSWLDVDAAEVVRTEALEVEEQLPHPRSMMLP